MSKTITISLNDFIVLALGHERRGTRALSLETAIILNHLIKDDTLYKVQFESWNGEVLSEPVLWSYQEWYDSFTKYKNLRFKQEQEEVRIHLFDANIKLIVRVLMSEYSLDIEAAKATAFSLLKANKIGNIRALGITSLFTKEEDIPKEIEKFRLDTRLETGKLVYGNYEIIK